MQHVPRYSELHYFLTFTNHFGPVARALPNLVLLWLKLVTPVRAGNLIGKGPWLEHITSREVGTLVDCRASACRDAAIGG